MVGVEDRRSQCCVAIRRVRRSCFAGDVARVQLSPRWSSPEPLLVNSMAAACNSPKHLPQAPPGKLRDVLLGVEESIRDRKDKVLFGRIQCFFWDGKNVFSTFSEVKWVSTIVPIVLDILEGQKREVGFFTVGDPKAAAKAAAAETKQQQKQHKQQEKQ